MFIYIHTYIKWNNKEILCCRIRTEHRITHTCTQVLKSCTRKKNMAGRKHARFSILGETVVRELEWPLLYFEIV